MQNVKKLMICLILLFSLFFVVNSSVSAANINVNNNTDIQKAIDDSKNGDTINFEKGDYKNLSLKINK